MSEWHSKKTVQYGDLGEQIVDDLIFSRDFIPYIPSPAIDVPHPFDRLCASRDKRALFIAEIKTKPARVYYPDTGINERNYREYVFVRDKYSLDVLLFFVDEDACAVYGNLLTELEKPRSIIHKGRVIDYPLLQGGIRYFPLEAMKRYSDINDVAVDKLRSLSSRSKRYADTVTEAA